MWWFDVSVVVVIDVVVLVKLVVTTGGLCDGLCY